MLAASSKEELKSVFNPTLVDSPSMTLNKLKLLFLTKVGHHDLNIYTKSISCWHQNSSESDAMWALYAQRNAGVAIKSTVPRVLKAFESTSRNINIAKVNYNTDDNLSAMTQGIHDSILIKRHAFHHENEIRIIASTLDGYENAEWTEANQTYNIDHNRQVSSGYYIDCDLNSLIDEVVISPLIPDYTYQAIETVSKEILSSIPIRKSILLAKDDYSINVSNELSVMLRHYQRTRLIVDFDEIPPDERL